MVKKIIVCISIVFFITPDLYTMEKKGQPKQDQPHTLTPAEPEEEELVKIEEDYQRSKGQQESPVQRVKTPEKKRRYSPHFDLKLQEKKIGRKRSPLSSLESLDPKAIDKIDNPQHSIENQQPAKQNTGEDLVSSSSDSSQHTSSEETSPEESPENSDVDTTASQSPVDPARFHDTSYKYKNFTQWDKSKSFMRGMGKGILGGSYATITGFMSYKFLKNVKSTTPWLCGIALYTFLISYGACMRNFFIFSPPFSNQRKDERIKLLETTLNSIKKRRRSLREESKSLRSARGYAKIITAEDKFQFSVIEDKYIKSLRARRRLYKQDEAVQQKRNYFRKQKLLGEDLDWQTTGYWPGVALATAGLTTLYLYYKSRSC